MRRLPEGNSTRTTRMVLSALFNMCSCRCSTLSSTPQTRTMLPERMETCTSRLPNCTGHGRLRQLSISTLDLDHQIHIKVKGSEQSACLDMVIKGTLGDVHT